MKRVRSPFISASVPLRAALGIALLLPAACVVERPSNPGVPVRASSSTSSSPSSAASLPAGPVAQPVNAPSTNATIRLDIEPLGTVVYDGQALPLASPDGRWLAVQAGEPPDWATILADDGAAPPNRTSLTIFDASSTLKALSNTATLPPGLMLGRAADNAGFLVEAPQHDGSRWIGKVLWASGHLDWVVKDSNINAHATLTSDGTLLYTSRAVGEKRSALCLLSSAGADRLEAPDASYAYPLVGDDPSIVYVPRQSAQGTELEAIRLLNQGKLTASKFGSSLYRRPLASSPDVLLAHQMAITSPGALPLRAGDTSARVIAPLVCLSPRHARIGAFDADTGSFQPLVSRSIAAAASPDPAQPGYFCTLNDSLVFVPRNWKPGETPVTILGEPLVPRASFAPDPQLLLFGPVPNSPDQLKVLRLHLTEHTK